MSEEVISTGMPVSNCRPEIDLPGGFFTTGII